MHVQGDASTRAYERLVKPTAKTAHPDDLAARGRTARRCGAASPTARSPSSPSPCTPSSPCERACARSGFSAPQIYAADLEAGLLLIEDLGSEPVVDAAGPIPERYEEAVAVLADLHGRVLPHRAAARPGEATT